MNFFVSFSSFDGKICLALCQLMDIGSCAMVCLGLGRMTVGRLG